MAGIVLLCTAATANAAIYRCIGDSGVIEYSNTPPPQGQERRCEQLELPQITTIPAPAPQAKPAAKSRSKADSGDVPSVSRKTQSRRDDQRLQILLDEYRKESARLAELRAEYRDGQPERRGNERNYQKYLDRVERLKSQIAGASGNLEALQSEMNALRN